MARTLILVVAVAVIVFIILGFAVNKWFWVASGICIAFDFTYAFMAGADETNKQTGGDKE